MGGCKAIERINYEIEHEKRSGVHSCNTCGAPCEHEMISHVVEKDGVITEDLGFCTIECFYEAIEDEVIEAKAEAKAEEMAKENTRKAIQNEWDTINDCVCPACKERLKVELARK